MTAVPKIPPVLPRAKNPRAMLTPALKKRVEEKLKECMALAKEKWPDKEFPMPKVHWDVKSTDGGLAYCREWFIRLNLILCYENEDHFINVVVPHEFAHLVNHRVHGFTKVVKNKVNGVEVEKIVKIRAHGPEWRQTMMDLNQLPKVHHPYDVSSIERKKRSRKGSILTLNDTMTMIRRLQNGVKRLPEGAKETFATWLEEHMTADSDSED